MKRAGIWIFLIIGIFFVTPVHAKITIQDDIDIRILYDGSGSMYPGYQLPGKGGTSKSRSGVGFFHEYPEFRKWFKEVIASQSQLNGKNVSLSVFIENELVEILPPTPREQITLQTITDAFEKLRKPDKKFRWGQTTYLTENLENFVMDFEGVVWLVTDNIIETNEKEHDYNDILSFFQSLKQRDDYYAVHLFKYPFEDMEKKQKANLAIYGILVSPEKIEPAVVEYYDIKFKRLKKLFPGQEYLKLKDLSVNPLELEAPLSVEIIQKKGSLFTFKERQTIQLKLDGKIQSNLTQHTVTSADYRIAVSGPFVPDAKSKKDYGVIGISSGKFKEITGSLAIPIPPLKTQQLKKIIPSKEPITIDLQKGIVSFVKSAFGMRVKYTGKVRFSLYNVKVKLDRGRIAGIYGIDKASSVFDFQDVNEINVRPRLVEKSFYLETGSLKGLILLLLLVLVLVPIGLMVWFLLQKSQCRVRVDQDTKIIPFMRFGSHSVAHEGKPVGTIKRGFGNDYTFNPVRGPGLTVNQQEPGNYDVTLRGKSFALTIEPVGGGTVKTGSGSSPGPGSRPPDSGRPGPSVGPKTKPPGADRGKEDRFKPRGP